MIVRFTDAFVRVVEDTVLRSVGNGSPVDVGQLCQRIQDEAPWENVALEDIELLVLKLLGDARVPVYMGPANSILAGNSFKRDGVNFRTR